ncbi:MAG: pentapeptide repeat-containing protein [Anaerolineales bacterium]|nr:pentapeptide repeat-containing protein [Anaerolineales bacterium]
MNEIIEISLLENNISYEFNHDESYETIGIPQSLIPIQFRKSKDLYAFKIKDNSAKEALLLPEDIVILKKLRTQPQNGDFIVYQNNGQIKFGYYFKLKNGYKLQPLHPHLKSIEINSANEINFISQVILVIRNTITDFPVEDEEILTGFNNRFQVFHNNIKEVIRKKRQIKVMRIIIFFFATAGLIWFIINIFSLNWPIWTGFQSKTLWDWLELLIIPAAISFGIGLLNRSQQLNEQMKTEEIAKENALQQYLDKMTELLSEESQKSSTNNSEQNYMARTRTLTVLRGLDGERKGFVIRFLHEAALIQGSDDDVKILLVGSDLSYANFSGTTLKETNLNGTNLYYANMENSDLSNSYLKNSFLYGANLARANLSGADLSMANLENTDLTDADLREAILVGAIVTSKQLKKAKSIDGIILSKGFSTETDD